MRLDIFSTFFARIGNILQTIIGITGIKIGTGAGGTLTPATLDFEGTWDAAPPWHPKITLLAGAVQYAIGLEPGYTYINGNTGVKIFYQDGITPQIIAVFEKTGLTLDVPGAGVPSATPFFLDLGPQITNAAGLHPKIKVSRDNVSGAEYGVGVSPGLLESMVPAGGGFAWYVNGVLIAKFEVGKFTFVGVPVHANNAAAIAGGLTAGMPYRLGADPDHLCIVH